MILKLSIYIEVDRPQKEAEAIKGQLDQLLTNAIRETQKLKDSHLKKFVPGDTWNEHTDFYHYFNGELRTLGGRCIKQEEVLNTMRTKG